jgi:dienelactone hydrolase
MSRLTALAFSLGVAAAMLATMPGAHAEADCSFDYHHPAFGLGAGSNGYYEKPPPIESWEGTGWQSQVAAFPSAATGARLCGTIFAPDPLPSNRVPAIVIVSASGPGVQSQYHWSARELADHGYVVVTIDVQGQGKSDTMPSSGNSNPVSPESCEWTHVPTPDQISPCKGVPFQQFGNFLDAVISGVNYMTSSSNPFASVIDTTKIGAAGHSMGARAVSYAQGIDTRIDAIVAWDNLASTTEGDDGSASGGPPIGSLIGGEIPGTPLRVTPRVPAMGQASEYSSGLKAGHPIVLDDPTAVDPNPEWKKTAYEVWRAAGVDTMQLTFRDSVHGSWAQGPWTTASEAFSPGQFSAMAQSFEYYTRAWFDRWLKGQTSAKSTLLATSFNGTTRDAVLSDIYHSAAAFDGENCPDLKDPARPTSCDS